MSVYIALIIHNHEDYATTVGVYSSEESALIALYNTLAEKEFIFNFDDSNAFWNDVDDELLEGPDILSTKKRQVIEYFRERIHSVPDLQRICTYYSENNFEDEWQFRIDAS